MKIYDVHLGRKGANNTEPAKIDACKALPTQQSRVAIQARKWAMKRDAEKIIEFMRHHLPAGTMDYVKIGLEHVQRYGETRLDKV